MGKFASTVVRHKKTVIIIFSVITLVCAFLSMLVEVNYDMVDYLPPNAQSTTALEIMNEEFTQSTPNASVMIKDISIPEAIDYKQKLSELDGVNDVLWLDDAIDIKEPLEIQDTDTVEQFYKDGSALFSVTIEEGMEKDTCGTIRELIGEDNALTGEAPNTEYLQRMTGSEVLNAMAILLPIFILILILSTTSWVEPLLFLGAIGISVVINMGTNVFFGEISFMTNSVTPILQLACTLDYAIFLLHSFDNNRKKYADVNKAMRNAIKESFPTVAASAATTLFGFLALVFMNFRIGADLGFALAKGIVLSFISVMVFLPALTLLIYKAIDKTKHREFMPSFKKVNKVLLKLSMPILILVIIFIVPCFLGQSQTNFTYGVSASPNSRSGQDEAAIEETFGQSTITVLLVPRGDVVKEEELSQDIEKLDHVTGVISYTTTVGTAIPVEFLDKSITEQFYSENYARIIIYTDTPEEGDIAFNTVENIQSVAKSYYGDTAYTVGQSANLYDMKTVVQKDNMLTNIIAVIAIFIVLVLTFKSATLPFLLLLTIESAIWINLSIPYFTGTSINYIGYLVLNTVQLGSTVDYAILLTVNYMRNRKLMPRKEAISLSLKENFRSILVSATTLAAAGFTLYLTSSNPITSILGMLLGRGTLLSMLMVVCFLPGLLMIFDKAIGKTTYKAEFFLKNKKLDDNDFEENRNEI
ncbi:MAG: MMPL family transporter [Eubacteriales bacterium]